MYGKTATTHTQRNVHGSRQNASAANEQHEELVPAITHVRQRLVHGEVLRERLVDCLREHMQSGNLMGCTVDISSSLSHLSFPGVSNACKYSMVM